MAVRTRTRRTHPGCDVAATALGAMRPANMPPARAAATKARRWPEISFMGYFFYRVGPGPRSEEHTSELQSHSDLVCRLLLEKKKMQSRFTLQVSKVYIADDPTPPYAPIVGTREPQQHGSLRVPILRDSIRADLTGRLRNAVS